MTPLKKFYISIIQTQHTKMITKSTFAIYTSVPLRWLYHKQDARFKKALRAIIHFFTHFFPDKNRGTLCRYPKSPSGINIKQN